MKRTFLILLLTLTFLGQSINHAYAEQGEGLADLSGFSIGILVLLVGIIGFSVIFTTLFGKQSQIVIPNYIK